MIKTFFASTALATTLGFAALAQTATDPAVKQPDAQAPAEMAPATPAPSTEAQSTEPAAPMGAEPSTETAEPATPMGTEPATETAEPATPMGTEPAGQTADDAGATGTMTAPVAGAEQTLTPVAAGDISADKLIGAKIQTRAGEDVAEVDDVLMGTDDQMESVVAQFGGFLGFGSNKVELKPDEIEVLQDESGTYVVQTDLTPDSLEGRPEYTAKQ
jgi:hypothetical protein